MGLLNILEVIFLLVIPTAVIGFYFPQKLVEHAAGKKVSLKTTLFWAGVLALTYIAWIAYSFFSIFNPSWPQLDLGIAFIFIPFIVASIHLIIRQILAYFQYKREKILLELGRVNQPLMLLTFAIFLLNGLLIFRFNPESGRLNFMVAFGAGLYISCTIVWLILYFSRVYLTEDGMVYSLFRTRWERITSYQWGKTADGTIPLTIKGGRETKVKIPVDQQDKVEALFEARQVKRLVPAGSAVPPWKKDLPDYEIEFRETMDAIKARRPKPVVAPLQKRLGALIIDGTILFVPLFFIALVFLGEWAYTLGPYGRILTYAIIIGYLGYSFSDRRMGQTVGQRLVGVSVVTTILVWVKRFFGLPLSVSS